MIERQGLRNYSFGVLIAMGLFGQLVSLAVGREWSGRYRVELTTPGGSLPFSMEMRNQDGVLAAWIENGKERIPVPKVTASLKDVRLEFPHYDSALELKVEEGQLDGGNEVSRVQLGNTMLRGSWKKRRSATEWTELTATAQPETPAPFGDAGGFVGRWRVRFASEAEDAVGVFESSGAGHQVLGTFLTTTGDYRYLAGGVVGEVLTLSCFDGAHAFLFKSKRLADGGLVGDFWSGATWHDTWTAELDHEARLADPLALAHRKSGVSAKTLSFEDVTGKSRSLAEPGLLGSATIIEIFGTWCPNCHDAAPLLAELRKEFGAQGLRVVGLAFELTGDRQRDLRQVATYVAHHQIEYPVLWAGTSDRAEAVKRFPLLDQIVAYPTFVFLNSDGQIHAVYTGFSGPATGAEHDRLKAQFRELISELLPR